MNACVKTHRDLPLTTWLDVLSATLPARGTLVIGAGKGIGSWVRWLGSQSEGSVWLVEGDESQYQHLQRNISPDSGWTLRRDVVAATKKPAIFHHASNPAESSLLRPELLRSLWPNLVSEAEFELDSAVTLDNLLTDSGGVINWLVLDCLPAADLLQGGSQLLPGLDVALVRVVVSESTIAGAGHHAVDVLMRAAGLACVRVQPERHPALAHALYVRDVAEQCQLLSAARADSVRQQQALQQALRASAMLAQELESVEKENKALASQVAALLKAKDTETFGATFAALDELTAILDAEPGSALDDDNRKDLLLEQASGCLKRMVGQSLGPGLVLDIVQTTSGPLSLLHIRDDYIPAKVVREGEYYELKFLQALSYFHRPEGLVIDVGANIGNHTVYFARVLGADVAAFEPQPHNALCLELNIRLNGVRQRVTTHRCALGKEPGEAVLAMSIDSNYGSFSIAPGSNPNGKSASVKSAYSVPVSVLDDILDTHYPNQQISLMKVDVEGMEPEVIRGATQTIQRWQPVIACECFDQEMFERVDHLLSEFGYSAAAMFNMTPTFLFYCSKNLFHVEKLAEYLRKEAIAAACGSKGFLHT